MKYLQNLPTDTFSIYFISFGLLKITLIKRNLRTLKGLLKSKKIGVKLTLQYYEKINFLEKLRLKLL